MLVHEDSLSWSGSRTLGCVLFGDGAGWGISCSRQKHQKCSISCSIRAPEHREHPRAMAGAGVSPGGRFASSWEVCPPEFQCFVAV